MSGSPAIDSNLANQVLWTFGYQGFAPGTFQGKLLDLIAHADKTNEAKLALGFPAETAAVLLAKNDPDGIAKLTAIADGQVAA
ncbi:hypothetical protein OTB20_19600 [Streptomyces sp. H27-H1]|uniref:hypothetical protein n=1 Tax=Streptomyces sp. H27-H1 TaxID=2996461 RepID=UPI002270EE8D|nr:hypothetical protein [Streptomyces sp. H27-H1]MCY0928363.1 hypothetical protein [Streptomyces sp. H27-H1]